MPTASASWRLGDGRARSVLGVPYAPRVTRGTSPVNETGSLGKVRPIAADYFPDLLG